MRVKRDPWRRQLPLHLMLIPGIVILLIFSYGPMLGLVMAFQNFNVARGFFGSTFVGLDNFRFALQIPGVTRVLFNTVFISVMKIVARLLIPIIIALLLNEVGHKFFKRSIQTIVYLPHFLSWVLLAGIFVDILSPSHGIVNQMIVAFGGEPVFFLGNEAIFPYVLVVTDIWKDAGFATIIYLAALTNIDPTLYEAAAMDRANRWQQTWHVTLPGMRSIIVLMAVLSLGNVLNAGFDQVFNLYNPLVMRTGDIIDTLVFRMGLIQFQYSLAATVGFFRSVISCVLIVVSYQLAYKYADYRIF